MLTPAPLIRAFGRAGLPLEVASAPLFSSGRGQTHIVQLDIARERRGERFRVWPGAEGNRVEVEGWDRDLRQLVLMVEEPRRRFEVRMARNAALPRGMRVVRTDPRDRWVEQWTSALKRHFLCGMDEAHLFIAGLPRGVSTVRAAHEALRHPAMTELERGAPARTLRQGEWFFVALSPSEEAEVEQAARRGATQRKVGIAQAARVPRSGRPHVADEVVVTADPKLRSPFGAIYVRGSVRHPDHRTVVLRAWRRAVPNAESMTTPAGVFWVD